jgi:hypothetical protein
MQLRACRGSSETGRRTARGGRKQVDRQIFAGLHAIVWSIIRWIAPVLLEDEDLSQYTLTRFLLSITQNLSEKFVIAQRIEPHSNHIQDADRIRRGTITLVRSQEVFLTFSSSSSSSIMATRRSDKLVRMPLQPHHEMLPNTSQLRNILSATRSRSYRCSNGTSSSL